MTGVEAVRRWARCALWWALAAGGLSVSGCDGGGGSGGAGVDCRQAAATCAPGFSCQPDDLGRFVCVPGGADVGPGGAGGAGGGGGGGAGGVGGFGGGGAGGEGGEGGEGGGAPPDAGRVEVSNARFVNLTPDAVTGHYPTYSGDNITLQFDYFISQGAGCPSCRSQIVVAENGRPLTCAYDGNPGLGGESGRYEGRVAVGQLHPIQRAFERTWKRVDAADCDAALAAFAERDGPAGTLATYEVKNPIAPLQVLTEQRLISGDEPVCLDAFCPEGTVVVAAHTEVGGEHDLTAAYAVDDRTWRHCYAPERPGVPVRDARVSLTCITPVRATVRRVEVAFDADDAEERVYTAECPPGSVVSFVGGRWPAERTLLAAYFTVDDRSPNIYTGQLTLSGGGPGQLQLTCIEGLGVPIYEETFAEVPVGGQCLGVECSEGRFAIGGFGAWGTPEFDLEVFGPLRSMVLCAVNARRPTLPVVATALCHLPN